MPVCHTVLRLYSLMYLFVFIYSAAGPLHSRKSIYNFTAIDDWWPTDDFDSDCPDVVAPLRWRRRWRRWRQLIFYVFTYGYTYICLHTNSIKSLRRYMQTNSFTSQMLHMQPLWACNLQHMSRTRCWGRNFWQSSE